MYGCRNRREMRVVLSNYVMGRTVGHRTVCEHAFGERSFYGIYFAQQVYSLCVFGGVSFHYRYCYVMMDT